MTQSNSIPSRLDFEHFRGNTFRRQFTITESDNAYDLSAATIVFLVRKVSSRVPSLTLQESSGVTVSSNVITVVMSAAQIEALGNVSKVNYELQVNQGSDITTWLSGEIRIASR